MTKRIATIIIIFVIIVISGLLGYLFVSQDYFKIFRNFTSPETTEERPLRIAALYWKPYIYQDNDEYTGIAIDVIEKAMERAEIPYTLQLYPWPRALKMAEVGEVDAVLMTGYHKNHESFIAYTPEQLIYGRGGEFPRAYVALSELVFFIRSVHDGTLSFESFKQIERDNYHVGLNKDYSYTTEINQANWEKTEFVGEEAGFIALSQGLIDVFLANKIVSLEILNNTGLGDEITYINRPVSIAPMFLSFSKKSSYLNIGKIIKQIDEELVKIHKYEYNEIYKKYE